VAAESQSEMKVTSQPWASLYTRHFVVHTL
jgi:hypothetical protein